jgi:hypothetical protein
MCGCPSFWSHSSHLKITKIKGHYCYCYLRALSSSVWNLPSASTISRRFFFIGKIWGVFTGTPTHLIKAPTSHCIILKNGVKAYRFWTRNRTVTIIFNELTLTGGPKMILRFQLMWYMCNVWDNFNWYHQMICSSSNYLISNTNSRYYWISQQAFHHPMIVYQVEKLKRGAGKCEGIM